MPTISSVPTLTVVASIVLTCISLPAYSQDTTANCQSKYDWMNNALGQGPCTVSSWLLNPCSGVNGAFIPALMNINEPYRFNVPQGTAAPCTCNTVLFSTMYACAACQGGEAYIIPWNEFSVNCTQPPISSYPEDVPSGTSIPEWAFLDLTDSGTLDLARAEQIANKRTFDSCSYCQSQWVPP
ncbi:hypothetical protein C2E23DRAFT_99930 [Lenzites betulinus]|nr:hypothetical protein C2E23DRAFT_99930 [Lenzites betulinus]